MPVTMTLSVSCRQQWWLVTLFLLLWWLAAKVIEGWQWLLFAPCWCWALGYSWYRLLQEPPQQLQWDGKWLTWQGHRYVITKRSRILPGLLKLSLRPELGDKEELLWITADALVTEHYRQLARIIAFQAEPNR